MLSRRHYILVGVVLLATYISAEILTPCEKADDRVADKESCTRYHICRVDPDSEDDFLSDIAICPTMMVFDMVSTQCVDVKQGYLQDPAGCNTFYGCRLPSRSSEGYLRTRYRCPGELRFHPQQGFCTHITDVPDTLCNSHIAVQAILGQQESDKPLAEPETPAEDAEGDSGGAATQSESVSSNQDSAAEATAEEAPVEESPAEEAPAEEAPAEEAPAEEIPAEEPPAAEAPAEDNTAVETPSEGTVERFDSGSTTSNGTVFRIVTPGERPAKPLTDIDKIAQVIKGQLLTRRKTSQVSSKLK